MNILTISEHTFSPDFLSANPVVVDFGTHYGGFMYGVLSAFPKVKKYIGVEANTALYKNLCSSSTRPANTEFINAVASFESGVPTEFTVDTERPYASSAIFKNKQLENCMIDSVSLSDILKSVEHIDLLKLDIEGSEWGILENFDSDLFSKIDQITVEFHCFLDADKKADTERCIKILTDLGYKVHGTQYHDLLFYKEHKDITKSVFSKVWKGGYREDWSVYGALSGQTEEAVVEKCIQPFYDKNKVCLEVGCGLAFWTDRYLAENFKQVIAIDVLPKSDFDKIVFKNNNIKYIELPDRSFNCEGVEDNSIDFVFSFGVFCHLSLEANQEYLNAIYKKCVSGAKVSLFYSNNDRRVVYDKDAPQWYPTDTPMWCKNDFDTTKKMLELAGFTDVYDLMPELFDTMICGTKPDNV